jgi:hypothetical protein
VTTPAEIAPGRPRARLAVAGLAGLAGLALSWWIAHHALVRSRWAFVAVIAAWVPVWVVGLAVLLRLAAATGPTPSISNDVFRYAWDAHVQLSGVDPYRYPPDAPQLERLRTLGFWPDPAGCHRINARPGCTVLNRAGDRTIYPAVAEGWFVLVHLFNPGDAGSHPWQLAGGFVDDGVVIGLALALRDRGRDPRSVAWYALSPLPVIEFAGNGHVDGVALALLVGALATLHRGRRGWAGLLIGLAIMVKLYPGVALAAGWRKGRWRMVLAAAAVCVLTEAPHVVAVGTRVIGYIPGYLKEEKYSSGGRFLLLGLLHLHGRVSVVVAVLAVLAATVYVWRARLDPAVGLTIALATLMFITTPVQPWYAVAVAGVAVLAGRPWLLAVPLAAEPYYAAVILHHRHAAEIGRMSYGGALLVVLAAAVVERRRDRHAALLPAGPSPLLDTEGRP